MRTYLESTLTFLMCAHSMEKELERASCSCSISGSGSTSQPSPSTDDNFARILQLYRELLPMAHYAKQLVHSELELLSKLECSATASSSAPASALQQPNDPLYLVRIRLLLVLRYVSARHLQSELTSSNRKLHSLSQLHTSTVLSRILVSERRCSFT